MFLRGPREIKLVERMVWAKHQSLPQGMASWVRESHSDLVPELAVSSTAKFSVLEIAVASEKSTSRTMEAAKAADVVMTDASPATGKQNAAGGAGAAAAAKNAPIKKGQWRLTIWSPAPRLFAPLNAVELAYVERERSAYSRCR